MLRESVSGEGRRGAQGSSKKAGTRRVARRSFTVGGVVFPSKKEAAEACSAEIAARRDGEIFESALLSDLIAEHHYYCSRNGLRPTEFQKTGGKHYHFRGCFPWPVGWRLVSWRKCLNQPTLQSEVAAFFRREFAIVRWRMSEAFPLACSKCSSRVNVHVHHERPSFKEMMTAIWPLFSDKEKESWLGFSWATDDAFSVPLEHPAHQEYLRLQAGTSLVPLCQRCHAGEHRAPRAS